MKLSKVRQMIKRKLNLVTKQFDKSVIFLSIPRGNLQHCSRQLFATVTSRLEMREAIKDYDWLKSARFYVDLYLISHLFTKAAS